MTASKRSDARILVVDDEPSVVRLLVRSLASAGYSQTAGLNDSTEALEYIEANDLDLVIMDLTMPGIDGFELLRKINASLPGDAFLPVLVLSGLHDGDSKERAFQAGAKDYMTKPVELREFTLHVDSLLDTRLLNQRMHEAQAAAKQDAARELSQTEFKLRTVADFAHDWEYWVGRDDRFVWLSPSVERITGYRAADFVADPGLLDKITHPEDRAIMTAHCELVKTQEGAPFDFRIVTKTGEVRWMAHRCVAVMDDEGRHVGRRCSNTDITDRKAAERLLRLTQYSVDHLNDAVFWLDSEGKVLFVTEGTCRALSYTTDELLAMTVYQVDPTLSEERYRRTWEKIKAEGGTIFETLHRRKDGVDFPVEADLNYVIFEDKEYNCVLARDITERKRTAQRLDDTLDQLRESQATIIQVLSSVTELRDPYTAGHQQRVAEICVAIASRLGLSPERVEGLEVAALLHDVGKVSVPLEVLSIPGKFTMLQRMLVEGHVAAGYEILKPINLPWPVAEITLQHHERLDGSGYPGHLKGEQIMLEARILAVADSFQAMTTHRPHRGALEVGDALKELAEGRDTVYDARVVDACRDLVEEGVIAARGEPDLSVLSFMT